MEHLGDLAPVLDVEDAEVAGDVNRRAAAGGAVALLPAGLVAGIHRALGAGDEPAVRLVACAVILGKLLSDLPTASHVPPSQQKRLPLRA
jgi:hypothetical protein